MTRPQPLILLATDFSTQAGAAYGAVVDLARQLGASILLAHVVESSPITPHGAPLAPVQLPPDMGSLLKTAQRHMAQEIQKLGTVVHVEVACVPGPDVAHSLTELAKERGAAFIAISTHGRTGIRRLVLGSIAEAVVRHSSVPVICFPSR